MGLVEFIINIVPSDFREECLGDLYEGYYRLKGRGHSNFSSSMITAWHALALVGVGLQMRWRDLQDKKQPLDTVPPDKSRAVLGLIVHNGENYLRGAIESVLAQALTDFRLIISDKNSTDSTPDICREYAARDSRITYYRHSKDIKEIDTVHKGLVHAASQERLRQSRYSFNIALTVTSVSTCVSLIGFGLILSGKLREGTVTTASGLASSIYCLRFAKDANDRLDRVLKDLNDSY